MKKNILILGLVLFFPLIPVRATDHVLAFQASGCSEGQGCGQDCASCHVLTKAEAKKLIKADAFKAEVVDVRMSPVKGLWEIELIQGGKKIITYVDFSKKYLVEAQFIQLSELGKPPEMKKLDISKIPLSGTVVMGNPTAKHKIIVFDDPDCPYCKKLHYEIKKILEQRKDIVFYIKLYPLVSIHPRAYEKSKAILCKKSVKLLEDAFEGKEIPKPDCETKEIDENLKLGESFGIQGTPAIVLPDGRLVPGFVEAQVLLDLLEKRQ